MLKSIIFDNGKEKIDAKNDIGVRLIEIKGTSTNAAINLSAISGYDGATHISSQIPARNIIIVLGFKHYAGREDAENDKERLYSIFPPKGNGTMYYISRNRNLGIEYIVESVEIPPNIHPLRAQISLTCPDPYFHDAESVPTVMATLTPNWEYPLKIEGDAGIELSKIDPSLIAKVTNTGQLPTGCVFEIRALGNLENPKLQDINTFKFIGAELSLAAGDVLLIDTRLGKKSLTKISGKVKKDVFNCLMEDSVFLQLAVGDNEFRRFADGNEDNMEVICRHENLSAGV